jgi:flagellar FliL protein
MGDPDEAIDDIEGTGEEEETLEAPITGRRLFGPSMVRMLVIIAGALVMIIISGTVAYIVAQRVGKPPQTERTSPERVEKIKPYSYFDLGEFSINTSDTDEPHFVKITLQLGYIGETNVELQTELNKRRAQLRDITISVIGSKKFDDLNTQDKRRELKNDIMERINSILIDGQIKEIAFTEFVLT